MRSETDEVETPRKKRPRGPGLSFRLFVLTMLFVLIAEAMIFLPSAAVFRSAWLSERVEMAQTAVLALEAAPERRVSDELSRKLLENARIVAVATSSDMGREIILSPAMEISGLMTMVDLRDENMLNRLPRTWATLFDTETDFLRIVQTPKFDSSFIEVVVEAGPLRDGLRQYSARILMLSLFLSAIVGSLIYLALLFVVVRPIRRITKSIERFRDDPRDWTSRIPPSTRSDEIGRAKNALSDMETAVKTALRERERLAQLGEAMAKINHDLRNSLTAAQIVSDGLTLSEDPRVRRAAPRLERAIERAIKLAEDTLQFGRSDPQLPVVAKHRLFGIIEEAAFEGLAAHDGVIWMNEVASEQCAYIEPDHLHRIIVNLVRNAAQAVQHQSSRPAPGRITVRGNVQNGRITLQIADDGPGIPERARQTLFKPFSASASRGGSGLGLAIARELAEGMDGRLTLLHTSEEGTVFELDLPSGD